MAKWCNGRRGRFKTYWGQPHGGSNPPLATKYYISPRGGMADPPGLEPGIRKDVLVQIQSRAYLGVIIMICDNCNYFNKGLNLINGAIFTSTHKGKSFSPKPFEYCPWCGNKLKEDKKDVDSDEDTKEIKVQKKGG